MSAELALKPAKVTGTMVAYYHICKRKLWLFAKGMDFEQIVPNDDILIGRLISQKSFNRERMKEIQVGDSVIDFLRVGDKIVVHEVKKSPKFEDAHIWQVKYYIYLLRKAGMDACCGVIHYPRSMRKVEVEFSDEDIKAMEKAIEKIKEVVNSPTPPPVKRSSFCKKCAYYEYCYI